MKTLAAITSIAILIGFFVILWMFKWWILGGVFVFTLGAMAYEKITGKKTKLLHN